jgi:hypothetical protein
VAILRHKDVCASMEGLQALCASQQSELHANATKLRDHERNARECEQLIADIRGEYVEHAWGGKGGGGERKGSQLRWFPLWLHVPTIV